MVKHAEGEGVGRRGSDIFLWGIRGQILCFRVMGVITSDRKHFSNTDPLCIAPAQVCVYVCVGGGSKIGPLLFGSY